MAADTRLIRTVKLTNFLSYGDAGREVELGPLNVLIGPNSSGKSNLIEAMGVLKAAPRDIAAPIREGGGVTDWIWKGSTHEAAADINATVSHPAGTMPLRYKLAFASTGQRFELVDEAVENERATKDHMGETIRSYYQFRRGKPVILVRTTPSDGLGGSDDNRVIGEPQQKDFDITQSVLTQRKDPQRYPEVTNLGSQFARIRLYREWNLRRDTPPRVPQKTDMPEDFLLEDASNLALVLNDLEHRGAKRPIVEHLRSFYHGVQDVTTKVHGGTIQIYVHEAGLANPVPATRLSDGTLRYLCLLSILCHPTPPPLICIEEPELGLHPDVLRTLAKLLVEASGRTQIIVTTHSDVLVSALSDTPECILICEKDEQGTRLERLKAEPLAEWLEKYSLGELWRMGEIGGTVD